VQKTPRIAPKGHKATPLHGIPWGHLDVTDSLSRRASRLPKNTGKIILDYGAEIDEKYFLKD
jgi:hypothetical protein